MIEDMNARKRGRHCQRSHPASCERFAAQSQSDHDGVKFLLRVTLRRRDLAGRSIA
jgi:hypothetical protein